MNSLDEIISKLDLHPEENSIEEVLRCIRKERAAIHPDKNNGKFSSQAHEDRWHELTQAKEQLESQRQLAVIPVDQIPAIIRAMKEVTTESTSARTSRFLTESRSSIHRATFFPKLSSGVFAGICGFLFTISGSLKDHPLLGGIMSTKLAQIMLFDTMLISGMFFILLWWREGRTEHYLAWLLTSEGKNYLLSKMFWRKKPTDDVFVFSFGEIVDVIYKRRYSSSLITAYIPFILFGSGSVDLPMAEKTARLIIDQLKEDQIITELPRKGLRENYSISAEAIKDIANYNLL